MSKQIRNPHLSQPGPFHDEDDAVDNYSPHHSDNNNYSDGEEDGINNTTNDINYNNDNVNATNYNGMLTDGYNSSTHNTLYTNNTYNPASSMYIVQPVYSNNQNTNTNFRNGMNAPVPTTTTGLPLTYYNHQLLNQSGDFSEIQTIDVNDNDYGNWDEIGPLTFETYVSRHYRELWIIGLSLFFGLLCLIGTILCIVFKHYIYSIIVAIFTLLFLIFGIWFGIQFQQSFHRKEPFLFRIPYLEQQQ